MDTKSKELFGEKENISPKKNKKGIKNKLPQWMQILMTKSEPTVRVKGQIDRYFFILVILLVCYGSVMVFSAGFVYAASEIGDTFYFIKWQTIFACIGIAVMIFVSRIDYALIKAFSIPIFFAAYALLWAVFIPGVGVVKNGARRWINLIVVDIQPSEIMKLGLIIILALYISKFKSKMNTFKYGILIPYGIIGVVCLTVALEKHMSGTIILFLIGTVMLFIGGASLKWLLGLGGGFGSVAIVAIMAMGYTSDRIQSWLHPEDYIMNGSWQPWNSLLAIGSGGFFGVGLGNSYEKNLWLPEPQNDFIFAVICEELGFVGAIVLIVLFALLVWRGFVIAQKAPDIFSSMLAFGLTSKVAIQVILNLCVVTTILPTTGISLPFFSYGGTALIVQLCEMGIVLSISRFSAQSRISDIK